MAWNYLPSEIFNIILQDADLKTIKNMRLVNKLTAQRCLCPRFLSHASHVQTDLTEKSLWNLIERALHPVFSRAVRSLAILAVCYDHRGKHVLFERPRILREFWNPLAWSRKWSRRFDEFYHKIPLATYDLHWLQQQQVTRDAISDQFIIQVLASALDSFTELEKLNLQAQVMTSPNQKWPPYAEFAPVVRPWISHVYYLVLISVAKSESTVPEINAFTKYEAFHVNSNQPCTFAWLPGLRASKHYCRAISMGELGHCLDKINEAAELRLPFERMDICLAAGRLVQPKQEPGWLQTVYSFSSALSGSAVEESPNLREDDLSGLMRLLKATPHLRALIVEFEHEHLANRKELQEVFTDVFNQVSFRQLKECVFIDVPVTSAVLLRFLEAHRDLERLSLEGLSIPTGDSWDPVFCFIGAEMMALHLCHIDQLYHGDARLPLNRENFSNTYCPRRAYLPIAYVNEVGPDVRLEFVPPPLAVDAIC